VKKESSLKSADVVTVSLLGWWQSPANIGFGGLASSCAGACCGVWVSRRMVSFRGWNLTCQRVYSTLTQTVKNTQSKRSQLLDFGYSPFHSHTKTLYRPH
jgi:hypothetical protein